MTDAMRRLAVYGTLRPGEPNHHQLSALRGAWSPGSVRGQVYENGWEGYPGLVLNSVGAVVAVAVFASDDLPDHWPRLDAFEGEGYRRVVTDVSTAGGVVKACIYVLAPRPGSLA